jgi:general secretion pathway protein A
MPRKRAANLGRLRNPTDPPRRLFVVVPITMMTCTRTRHTNQTNCVCGRAIPRSRLLAAATIGENTSTYAYSFPLDKRLVILSYYPYFGPSRLLHHGSCAVLAFQMMRLPYLDHFGLLEEPYSTSPNPRYLYISPTHNLALEKTKWTIAAKRGLALCFGAVGTGKTTLARELAQRIEDEPEVAYVFITNPNFPTPNQLLRAIIQEFEVPQTSKSYLDLLNIFKTFLMDQAVRQGKTLVLIIDEAQTLKAPLLELLRQLMNYESNDQKFLQVVLFAQEEFRARLQQSRYRNLVNRTAMSSTLDNLSLAETSAMLRHRWLIAGGKQFPFETDAVDCLYRHSQGIPRTQVILADNALLAAYLTGESTIGAALIESIVRDRGLPDTDEAPAPPAIRKHTSTGRVAGRRRA